MQVILDLIVHTAPDNAMAMPVPTAHGLMQQPKRRIDEEDPNAKFGRLEDGQGGDLGDKERYANDNGISQKYKNFLI